MELGSLGKTQTPNPRPGEPIDIKSIVYADIAMPPSFVDKYWRLWRPWSWIIAYACEDIRQRSLIPKPQTKGMTPNTKHQTPNP